jgi:hypothetical protein
MQEPTSRCAIVVILRFGGFTVPDFPADASFLLEMLEIFLML